LVRLYYFETYRFEMVAAQSHKSRHTMKRTRLIQIRAGDPSPARPPKASVE
jgi:hypothetical protein